MYAIDFWLIYPSIRNISRCSSTFWTPGTLICCNNQSKLSPGPASWYKVFTAVSWNSYDICTYCSTCTAGWSGQCLRHSVGSSALSPGVSCSHCGGSQWAVWCPSTSPGQLETWALICKYIKDVLLNKISFFFEPFVQYILFFAKTLLMLVLKF